MKNKHIKCEREWNMAQISYDYVLKYILIINQAILNCNLLKLNYYNYEIIRSTSIP